MKSLIFFLIVTFVSYFIIKPKKLKSVWIFASATPLGILILYILFSFIFSYKITIFSIVSFIISGTFLFFLLNKKFKNGNKNKFPVILFLSIFIPIGVLFIQSTINNFSNLVNKIEKDERLKRQNEEPNEGEKPKNEKLVAELDNIITNGTKEEVLLSEEVSLSDTASIKSFEDYQIYFKYKADWELKVRSLGEDPRIKVQVIETGYHARDEIAVDIWDKELPKKLYMAEWRKEFKNLWEDLITIYSTKEKKYRGYSCLETDYFLAMPGAEMYHRVIIINSKGKTFLIEKISDSRKNLDSKFTIFDSTFKIVNKSK